MAKNKDVLKQKQKELNTYIDWADTAISLVTSTIDTLGAINESIDTEIQEIDEYQAKLTATRSGLTSARAKNERIIKNFNALINAE
jgi:hypothetical protein